MVKEEARERSNASSKDKDEQYRKLFVGALSLQMTEDDLRTFYSQYGTITDCVVMQDPHTRRSRGFGFVTFASMDEVDKAMNARPHVIGEKTIDPKRAVPREASQKNEANISTKRLYVSGVRDDHTDKDFEEYFGKYGSVEKVEIIKDKNTGKYRGFAFISFDDYDPVDKCCLQRQHMILDHRCDVKKALSKEEIAKAQQMDRDRAERGNRSRGSDRNSRGSNGGWSERAGGRSWGGNTAAGYGAYGAQQPQPWGGAAYPAYAQPTGTGGWHEPVSAWGPPQGAPAWQPGPPASLGPQIGAPAPWQGPPHGGYQAIPPTQHSWGNPEPPQVAQGWGVPPNPRNY